MIKKLLICLIFILIPFITNPAIANIIDGDITLDIRTYNQGDNFAQAIAYANGQNKSFLITQTYFVTADTVIPSNMTLIFVQGGNINVKVNRTLTINGPIVSNQNAIITGFGNVVFSPTIDQVTYSNWFTNQGTITDNSKFIHNGTTGVLSLTNPAFSGTATGSITIPNLIAPSPIISNPAFSGTSTGTFTIGGTTYLGNSTNPIQDIITKGPWVDVRAFGAKGDGVTDDTAAIQAAINSVTNGGVIFLPTATYLINGTISLVNKTLIQFIGSGMQNTILKKPTTGNLLELSGLKMSVQSMTLDGINKIATTGLYIKGSPQAGVTSGTKSGIFKNLHITNFKEGLRIGHYSTLNGVTGDTVSPDIETNLFENLDIHDNDYNDIEDGQNILHNLKTVIHNYNGTNYLVYMPFGGDLYYQNAYLGAVTNNNPKIYTNNGNVFLSQVRSENSASINPPAIQEVNPVYIYIEHSTFTNIANGGVASLTNVDLNFTQASRVVIVDTYVDGIIQKSNGTQFIGLNNHSAGVDDNGIVFSASPIIQSTDGTYSFKANSGVNDASVRLYPSTIGRNSYLFMYPVPNGTVSAYNRSEFNNENNTTIIRNQPLNGAAAAAIQLQQSGSTKFQVDVNGNVSTPSQIISTLPTSTAPLSITSTTPVNNLSLGGGPGTTVKVAQSSYTRTTPTYSASINIDASLSNIFEITATNGSAFTINNPINGVDGQVIVVRVFNTSGVVLGTQTWGTAYKTPITFTGLATATNRSVSFQYNGTAWYEVMNSNAVAN